MTALLKGCWAAEGGEDRGKRTNGIYERGLIEDRGPLRTGRSCPHSSISPRLSMPLVLFPRSSPYCLATTSPPGDSSVRMRKLIIVTSLLLVAHIALLFTRRSAQAEAKGSSPMRIGIVLDVGGRGDKSFNDGAYAGADSATKVLGSNIRFIEPGEGADREAGLRLLAAEGMNLVIGVGFIFT